jgi:hypothetical protein
LSYNQVSFSRTDPTKFFKTLNKRVNQYFKEKNISLIKIDVEGHEINVLRGAKKTIKSHKPIILFEQGADEIHNGSSEAIDYLTSLDYSFYSIKRRFCLGENILAKIFSVALRSIFGDQLSLVETKKFPKKFYDIIIAVHQV